MLPFVRGEILSEITCYEPPRRLQERFWGAANAGTLTYEFVPRDRGTVLVQRETLQPLGVLKLVEPLIERML